MFRPPIAAEIREGREGEGGDALLVPSASYLSHVCRLACHRLVLANPADAIQPPNFPLTLLKVDAAGVAFTEPLPSCSAEEMEAGMEWRGRVYQVSSVSHQRLWRAANCFRAYASRAADASSHDILGPRSDTSDMVRHLATRVAELETEDAKLLQILQSRENEIIRLKERLARTQGETSAQSEARLGTEMEREIEAEAEGYAMGATEDIRGIPETTTLDMLSGMDGSESPLLDLEDLGWDDNIGEFVIAIGAASRGPP